MPDLVPQKPRTQLGSSAGEPSVHLGGSLGGRWGCRELGNTWEEACQTGVWGAVWGARHLRVGKRPDGQACLGVRRSRVPVTY